MAEKEDIVMRIEGSTAEALKRFADSCGLSLTSYVRLLLRQHIRTPMKIELKAG